MKIIPLTSIALVILLTSFPDPTIASYCKENLDLCLETMRKGDDRPTYYKWCDTLVEPGARCICEYLKDPVQKEKAFHLRRSCGSGISLFFFNSFKLLLLIRRELLFFFKYFMNHLSPIFNFSFAYTNFTVSLSFVNVVTIPTEN